jgi:hypothetical protein
MVVRYDSSMLKPQLPVAHIDHPITQGFATAGRNYGMDSLVTSLSKETVNPMVSYPQGTVISARKPASYSQAAYVLHLAKQHEEC